MLKEFTSRTDIYADKSKYLTTSFMYYKDDATTRDATTTRYDAATRDATTAIYSAGLVNINTTFLIITFLLFYSSLFNY